MAAAVALASPLRRILHVPYPRRAIPTPYHFFSRGWWHAALAVAAAAGGDAAVKGSVDRNAVEEVRNILDMLMQAERDSQRRDIFHTNFLTPPIIKEAILVIEKLADIKAVAQGGYPQAERCRISVGHPYSMTNNPDVVAALRFTGITREKVGDILLQVHCLPNCSFAGCCGHVTSTLEKVGEVGVSYGQIPLLALEYEPPRTKSFKTVESSLRFDALASAGFKISCTKLASLIRKAGAMMNEEVTLLVLKEAVRYGLFLWIFVGSYVFVEECIAAIWGRERSVKGLIL